MTDFFGIVLLDVTLLLLVSCFCYLVILPCCDYFPSQVIWNYDKYPTCDFLFHCFTFFHIRMWRSTQIQPRHWLTPWTRPAWKASSTSTLCCVSWPPAAWCRLFIFALVWTVISTTMAWPRPFIHTSRRLLGGKKMMHAGEGSHS